MLVRAGSLLKILAMIFGDLVCCVQFVVLLRCCTGAATAATAAAAAAAGASVLVVPAADLGTRFAPTDGTAGTQIVAAAQVRQPGPALRPSNNRTAGRYTVDSGLPGELNEYCRTSQDCRQHAHVCDVRKQSCSCAEGYRPDETNRVCLGAVGRRCLYDSHCITNAYCKGQMICTCKREYGYQADDNWACQASSAAGSPRIGRSRTRPGILQDVQRRLLVPLLVTGFSCFLSIRHRST